MAGLSLREAAQQAGTSKSTILRAVKAGRLSAARLEDGGYDIDPAELCRVYPPDAAERARERSAAHGAAFHEPTDATEIRIRNAALEAELRALRELVEELRADRGAWRSQAERLALAAPLITPAPAPVDHPPSRRRWWPWGRAA